LHLALDPAKREALGAAARQAAVECHSWSRNVACALEEMPANTSNHPGAQSLMTVS
jgi:hypothetical protein